MLGCYTSKAKHLRTENRFHLACPPLSPSLLLCNHRIAAATTAIITTATEKRHHRERHQTTILRSQEDKMPNAFHRTLQTYLSRARRMVPPSPENPSATATPSSSGNSTTSWLFSACRFPKTQSFALDRTGGPAEGVHEYLNSLYLTDDSDHPPEFTSNSGSQTSGFSTDSVDISQDLASAVASERFFIFPGTSNSILEECTGETPAKMQAISDTKTALVADGIAVTTFSPDPFADFRQSMQEMVEARAKERAVDWEYLEELFFCYMKLNHPRDHKFILGAFADLLASLGVNREVADPKATSKTGAICDAVTGTTTVNGKKRKGQLQSVAGLRTGKSSAS